MQKFGQGLKNNKEQSEILTISQYIKYIMAMPAFQDAPFFYEQLQRASERILDQSFRIAVVGEFSSGKSTFINALLGRDILKHGALETTATITEIENNPNKDTQDYFDVYFEDGNVELNLSIENIFDYTTTKSATHQVAKEIKRVVIHSHIVDTDKPLVLVDTPGLNGVADNHREKTLDQIERAHACIYLIPVRGLGESDIEFIKHITGFQQDIIFVQNFIDELEESEGESVEEKFIEQEEIIKTKILDENKILRYRMVGVSARLALMARDTNVLKEEGIEETSEIKKECLDKSCFEKVQQTLQSVIEDNAKNKNQISSSVKAVINILMQLESVVVNRWDAERQLWENSPDGALVRKAENLKDKLVKEKDKRRKEVNNFAISEGDRLEEIVRNKIEQEQDIAKENTVNKIKEIDSVEGFEDRANEIIGSLYMEVDKVQRNINKILNDGYENILQDALIKILEYNAIEFKQITPRFSNKGFQVEIAHYETGKGRGATKTASKKAFASTGGDYQCRI